MDKEKINKAANREAFNESSYSYKDRKEGFIKGAEWIMQQPLSERLTDEELRNIRRLYMIADNTESSDHAYFRVYKEVLIKVFGTDLFKEK